MKCYTTWKKWAGILLLAGLLGLTFECGATVVPLMSGSADSYVNYWQCVEKLTNYNTSGIATCIQNTTYTYTSDGNSDGWFNVSQTFYRNAWTFNSSYDDPLIVPHACNRQTYQIGTPPTSTHSVEFYGTCVLKGAFTANYGLYFQCGRELGSYDPYTKTFVITNYDVVYNSALWFSAGSTFNSTTSVSSGGNSSGQWRMYSPSAGAYVTPWLEYFGTSGSVWRFTNVETE